MMVAEFGNFQRLANVLDEVLQAAFVVVVGARRTVHFHPVAIDLDSTVAFACRLVLGEFNKPDFTRSVNDRRMQPHQFSRPAAGQKLKPNHVGLNLGQQGQGGFNHVGRYALNWIVILCGCASTLQRFHSLNLG